MWWIPKMLRTIWSFKQKEYLVGRRPSACQKTIERERELIRKVQKGYKRSKQPKIPRREIVVERAKRIELQEGVHNQATQL